MKNKKIDLLPFHYAWLITILGLLTLFAALGLGRFALGMLLPSMASTLALSYAQMGFIGTGNFIGYLAAVALSGYGVARYGSRQLIAFGLLMLGLSMAAVSRAESFIQVLILYCLTGLASGIANVPMMSLVTHWFSPNRRGRAAGILVMGNGFGIMFTGMLIPFVNAQVGAEGWRISWLVFGVVAAVIAVTCQILLRDSPQDMGLQPVGGVNVGSSVSQGASKAPASNSQRGVVLQFGSVYFLFGFTYAIYATFIVTTLVQERSFSEAAAGNVWFWIGLLSLMSGPLFGTLSDQLGRKSGLILVFALQGLAYILVAALLPHTFLYLSVGLFGICAWSIPSIMAAAVGDYMGPQRAAAVFGAITFCFGVGQVVGPALAGLLAERSGGFTSSYWLAASLAGIAILLTAMIRKPSMRL